MGRFIRSRKSIALLLLVCAFTGFSCKKNVALPPPAQAAPPPAPPAPPVPPPTITITANPATINPGQSTTVTWQATNAATVTIQPDLGNVPTTGTSVLSPASTVIYSATATGPGGSANSNARVTVNAPPPPAAPTPLPSPPRTLLPLDQQFAQAVQPIFFDYDRSDLRIDQVVKLQNNASWLKQNPTVRFTIEGHADERGSQEYNIALSDERAITVKRYLASQGIADNRMTTVPYGEERPECRTADESCYQRNRRAAFTMNR